MGGEGSILSMIVSLKNNNALRKLKRAPFRDLETRHHGGEPIVYENRISPGELAVLRKKLRRERMITDWIKITAIIFILASTFLLLLWMMK